MKEILDKTQKRSIDDRKRIVNKKFSRIVYLAVLLVIPILGYLQWGRDVAVCISNPNKFSNGSLEERSIISNKLYIFDREKFAKYVEVCYTFYMLFLDHGTSIPTNFYTR